MSRKKWQTSITIEPALVETVKAVTYYNRLPLSKLINYAILHLFESKEGKGLLQWATKRQSPTMEQETSLTIQRREVVMNYEDVLAQLESKIEVKKIE